MWNKSKKAYIFIRRIQEKRKKTESGPIPIPTKTKTCTETHKTHIPIHMPHSRVEYHAMPVASVVYCLIPTKHFQRINSMHLHNTNPTSFPSFPTQPNV